MDTNFSPPSQPTIWHKLVEPISPLPPIERSKARLLISFLLVLIVFAIIYEITYNMLRPGEEGEIENTIVVILLFVVFLLAKWGYWKPAAFLSVMILYLGILAEVGTSIKPLDDLNLVPFITIPLLISSIFFSTKSFGYLALIFSVGLLVLIPMTHNVITIEDLIVGPLFFLWIITGIVQISSIHRSNVEKQRQSELMQSEARFRQLAENIRDTVWNYDAGQKRITYISPACEQVFGLSAADFYNDPLMVLRVTHPEDHQKTQDALRAVEEGLSTSIEVRILQPDGSLHWIWFRGFPVLNSQNKIINMAGIASDITELKQSQQQLQEMNRTLENRVKERTEELVIANKSLSKAARMKDEFLAGMSHELRTPLTGVLGLSEALRLRVYGELNTRQLRTIETIEESGRHLLSLINDILDLSKIEAGKLELQITASSLDEVCKSSLQMIKGMADQKHQRVSYNYPDLQSTLVQMDARRIKQVLVNLLSNAVKFTRENGEIGLDVQFQDLEQCVMVTVWDKGIGIKPEDQHKLFKPFTQIDGSLAREYSGTGLGLSLAHRLTEAHNGNIKVESIFGEGSRFTVSLPLTSKAQSATNTSKDMTSGMNNNSFSFEASQLPLVLIADDNPVVLQMFADYLETNQYRVLTVTDGVELLAHVEQFTPDILLVDIQMPRMDGFETIHRVRTNRDPQIASIPIIAVTALAMPGDRERCLQVGANEYISKPVELLELSSIIKKYIPEN